MTARIHTRGGRNVWQPTARAPRHSSHLTVWEREAGNVAAIRTGFAAGLLAVLLLASPRILEALQAWVG